MRKFPIMPLNPKRTKMTCSTEGNKGKKSLSYTNKFHVPRYFWIIDLLENLKKVWIPFLDLLPEKIQSDLYIKILDTIIFLHWKMTSFILPAMD